MKLIRKENELPYGEKYNLKNCYFIYNKLVL